MCPFARQVGCSGPRYFPLATAWAVNALAASMDEGLARLQELQECRVAPLVCAVAELKGVIEAQAGQLQELADDIRADRLLQDAERNESEDLQASLELLRSECRGAAACVEAASEQLAAKVAALDEWRRAHAAAEEQRAAALEAHVEGFAKELDADRAQRQLEREMSVERFRWVEQQQQHCGVVRRGLRPSRDRNDLRSLTLRGLLAPPRGADELVGSAADPADNTAEDEELSVHDDAACPDRRQGKPRERAPAGEAHDRRRDAALTVHQGSCDAADRAQLSDAEARRAWSFGHLARVGHSPLRRVWSCQCVTR